MNKSNIQKNKLYRLIGYRVYEKTKENVQFVRFANIIEFVHIVLKKQKKFQYASQISILIAKKLQKKLRKLKSKFFFKKLLMSRKLLQKTAKFHRIKFIKIKRKLFSLFFTMKLFSFYYTNLLLKIMILLKKINYSSLYKIHINQQLKKQYVKLLTTNVVKFKIPKKRLASFFWNFKKAKLSFKYASVQMVRKKKKMTMFLTKLMNHFFYLNETIINFKKYLLQNITSCLRLITILAKRYKLFQVLRIKNKSKFRQTKELNKYAYHIKQYLYQIKFFHIKRTNFYIYKLLNLNNFNLIRRQRLRLYLQLLLKFPTKSKRKIYKDVLFILNPTRTAIMARRAESNYALKLRYKKFFKYFYV